MAPPCPARLLKKRVPVTAAVLSAHSAPPEQPAWVHRLPWNNPPVRTRLYAQSPPALPWAVLLINTVPLSVAKVPEAIPPPKHDAWAHWLPWNSPPFSVPTDRQAPPQLNCDVLLMNWMS